MSQFYWVAPGSAQVGSCQQRLSGDREESREAWRESQWSGAGAVVIAHIVNCAAHQRSETVDSNDTMAAYQLCFNILNIPSDGTSQIFLPWQLLDFSWTGRGLIGSRRNAETRNNFGQGYKEEALHNCWS